MRMKYVFAIAAAAVGSAAIAVAAQAHGFGPHGHHGSGAARSCIAVMTPDQRANLKTIFSGAKADIIADHQKVESAKQELALAILNKTGDVSPQENNLSAARLKLTQDEDAAAAKVCGLLNAKQLSAAEGLYKNMVALRQSTRQQAHEYFKQARSAAGDPALGSTAPGDTQGAPQSVE